MDAILGALPASTLSAIPQNVVIILQSHDWFPRTLADAFMPSLRLSFIIGAVLSAIAAVLSAMHGERYVHEIHSHQAGEAEDVSRREGMQDLSKLISK